LPAAPRRPIVTGEPALALIGCVASPEPMVDKTLTVILYGADRRLWAGGRPRLRVVDPRPSGGGGPKTLFDRRIAPPIVEATLDMPFDAGQAYVLSVEIARHRSAWHIVEHGTFMRRQHDAMVEGHEAILRLMLVPNRPESSDLDEAFTKVEEQSLLGQVWDVTEAEYLALPAERQMALLNLEAKLRETFVGDRSLLSFVTGLRAIGPDRLFLMTEPALAPLVALAPDFAAAAGHGTPEEFTGLPEHPAGWKHQAFSSGNLQLCFSAETHAWPPDSTTSFSHSVDADIDLARGVGHAVEWLHNNVFDPGHKTDQKRVYALLYAQGIYPHYTFDQLG
jgi:hypothetical protein